MRTRSRLAAFAATATVVAASLAAATPHARAGSGDPTGTTVDRTIVAPTSGEVKTVGLVYGPGEATIVPHGYSTKGLRSLVSFVQMTDVHVTDEESPGRLEFLRFVDPRFAGAYRPDESLSTQTLDSLVSAARNAVSPLTGERAQFAVDTGDGADNQQYNEVRWVVDLLDGGHTITPDTGAAGYAGVRGGGLYYEPDAGVAGNGFPNLPRFPNVDLLAAAQQSFTSIGMGMPWYAGFGNHDALVQGNVPLAFVGQGGDEDAAAGVPASLRGHLEIPNPSYENAVTGTTKVLGITPTSAILSVLPALIANPTAALTTFASNLITTTVPGDLSRCYLAKVDNTLPGLPAAPGPCANTSFTAQMHVTTGTPGGHGFVPTANPAGYGWPASAIANHDGYYSFHPAPGFRFITLDTTTDECGAVSNYLCDYGSLDTTQFAWLGLQLAAAHAARQHVIILSHHPLDELTTPSTDPSETWVTSAQVRNLLCSDRDVLATLAGHTHHNLVEYVHCDRSPGYARIQTTSGMDWPQQARLVEVVRNKQGKLAIASTMIDQAAPPGIDTSASTLNPRQLASISRVIAYQLNAGGTAAAGQPADRNILIPLHRSMH